MNGPRGSGAIGDTAHLSIGEVLNLLQEDFPDITISKIRFLESQGLLDPERTPSGYRKFYDDDIDRLRWILRHQREHFLPLKVIKDRLEHNGGPERSAPDPQGAEITPGDPPPTVTAASPVPDERRPGPRGAVADRLLEPFEHEGGLTVDQLAKEVGLSHRQLGELERFGLVVGEGDGAVARFGPDAVEAARLCRAFIDRGVEPRHLRMFKLTAEREAAFLDQMLLPPARRKGRAALREAVEEMAELAAKGEALRTLMLREQFRDDIDRVT